MSTNYPTGIDTFINPSASNHLDGPPGTTHADQHTNINDSMFALQTRVGVSASTVPNTIDFELHNTASGHDHDGVNSKLINLSTSGSASGSGYFPFTVTTSVGQAVFDINIALLNLSSSITNLVLSGSSSSIAFEAQSVELTPNAVRVNLSGSGVSGSISSSMAGDKVTYTIPGVDYRQIVFLRGCGPFEHFTTPNMFHSCTYYPNIPIVSASTWFTDVSMNYKIFETIYKTRNSKKQATEIIYNVYYEDGLTIKSQATDIVTYNGIVESSRLRTVT
jgi:hypothetical protein